MAILFKKIFRVCITGKMVIVYFCSVFVCIVYYADCQLMVMVMQKLVLVYFKAGVLTLWGIASCISGSVCKPSKAASFEQLLSEYKTVFCFWPGCEEPWCGYAGCKQREHSEPAGGSCIRSSRPTMHGTLHSHSGWRVS